jgi:hypothetical protein
MSQHTEIYFVNPKTKERMSNSTIIKLFMSDVDMINSSSVGITSVTITFVCVKFVGIAALCKTEGFIPADPPPNVMYINNHKLDEILTEFRIKPQLWRLCHKYLVGTFKLVQVNTSDLIQLI